MSEQPDEDSSPPETEPSALTEEDEERDDGDREESNGNSPKKAPEQILEQQIAEGTEDLERNPVGLALSALSAGLDLGFTVLLVGLVASLLGPDELHGLTGRALLGAVYPMGYVFVLLGRSSLFTEHTTLAVLPVLDGRADLTDLIELWSVVYVGNIAGVLLFGLLLIYIGPRMELLDPSATSAHAHALLDHPWHVLIASGVLAGWLMGLLSWLATASRDTISQLALVFLITGMIGMAGLHHCVAGAGELFVATWLDPGIGALDFLKCLGWMTLGNAIGGVLFVSLLKYSLVVRSRTPTHDVPGGMRSSQKS